MIVIWHWVYTSTTYLIFIKVVLHGPTCNANFSRNSIASFLSRFFLTYYTAQGQRFAQHWFSCSALALPTHSWCLFSFCSCFNYFCINFKSGMVYVFVILDNFCGFNLLHEDFLCSHHHFVAREIGGGQVTRADLNQLRHLALHVFEIRSKTCNALQSEIFRVKSCLTACYTVSIFSATAREIVVASWPV